MRKLRFAPMLLALAVCGAARSHVLYQASPCGFSNFYFSRVYDEYFPPSRLEAEYIEYMKEHGYTSCRIDNSGSPDLESCGGVDAAEFILRLAKEKCMLQSEQMNMPLTYDFSTTPFVAEPGEAHHKYRFAYGLLVSCGTCAPMPTE